MVETTNEQNEQNRFAVSLITPWIKGSMSCDNSFLKIDMPNTVFFGLIPAGKEKDSTPLKGVTNVYTSNSYKVGAILLGALIVLGGLAMFGSSAVGAIIMILIGLAILGGGIKTQFSYERSGIVKTINVPFFEADKVKQFEQKVIQELSGYQNDRNVRMQTEKSMAQSQTNTQAIVNAMNGQNEHSTTTTTKAVPQNDSVQSTSNVNSAPHFCPNCGAKVIPGNKFCTNCGAKLI